MFINKPLTNYDITNVVKELKIKNVIGVFTRDTLPGSPWVVECGVVNLDVSRNTGTHRVCHYKNKENSYYFDSFGLDPPLELRNYLNTNKIDGINLSTFQIQKFNTHHCGYYCLFFLKLIEKHAFKEIILDFVMTVS